MPIRSRENLIGAWAFLAGIVLAVLVGIFVQQNISPFIIGVLAVLGILVGYFVSEKNVQTFLIASVSLVITSFAGIQGMVLSAALVGIDVSRVFSSVLGSLLVLFVADEFKNKKGRN
mgnify:CR=1 FL=1